MNFIRRLTLSLASLCAIATTTWALEADDAYKKAVNDYVQAAGNEMQALKSRADVATHAVPADKQENYKEFYAKYERLEKTFKALKDATPKTFDAAKSEYEKERAGVGQALAEAEAKK